MVQRSLAPVGWKGAAVILDRLFAVLPLPPAAKEGPDPLDVYVDELQQYPGDVLARAVSAVIRHHRWKTPPTIADIVAAAAADPDFRQRQAWKTTLRILAMKPAEPAPVVRTPAEQALETARRFAMLAASDRHRGEPWPVRAAAINAAFERAEASEQPDR